MRCSGRRVDPDAFDVPPPVPVDTPVSMHLESADLLRARDLINEQPYQPSPPMPPELELLLDDFRKMSDLLAAIRDTVNLWADRHDITEQAAQLVAELLLSLHAGGYR